MEDQPFIKMFCHCLKKFLKNIDGCLIDRSPIRVNTDLSREDFLEIFRKSAEFSGNSRNSTKTRFYDHQFWHVFPETLLHSCVLHRIWKIDCWRRSKIDRFLRFWPTFFLKIKFCQNFGRFSPILSKFSRFCQIFPDFVRFFQILSDFSRFCQIFVRFFQILSDFCQIFPDFVRFLSNFSGFCQIFVKILSKIVQNLQS